MKLPTHKVESPAGIVCFRGSLTVCVRYINKTKKTNGYKIIKL